MQIYKATILTVSKVEIVRKTKDYVVFVTGKMRAKETGQWKYCDTWDEAKAWMISKAQDKFNRAYKKMQEAEKYLALCESLEEGEE